MDRHRVEDCAGDAFFFEVVHEAIAVFGLDGELVPDVVIAFIGTRQDQIGVGEFGKVIVGDFFALGVPFVELGNFGNKDGGLEFGHAAGVADFIVVIAFSAHSVDAEAEASAVDFIVVGEDHSAITSGPEVFGDVEADSGGFAEIAGVGAFVVAVNVLRRIFEDHQIVLFGNGLDGGDINHLSEKVDGEDRFGFGGDGGFDLCGIDAHGFPVDIDEYRGCTELDNNFGSCDECESRCDDLIAGADIARLHHDAQGIGAAVDAECVFDAVTLGDYFFELFIIFAEDIRAGGEDLGNCRIEGAPHFFVLGF